MLNAHIFSREPNIAVFMIAYSMIILLPSATVLYATWQLESWSGRDDPVIN